jgi:hypothetical protein
MLRLLNMRTTLEQTMMNQARTVLSTGLRTIPEEIWMRMKMKMKVKIWGI